MLNGLPLEFFVFYFYLIFRKECKSIISSIKSLSITTARAVSARRFFCRSFAGEQSIINFSALFDLICQTRRGQGRVYRCAIFVRYLYIGIYIIYRVYRHTTSVKAKARSFGKSAVALAAIGIISKLIGALYRVPLTNILGAEGMGMYQLVFPVFALFMVLSTAGIPTALSRMVAEKRAEGAPTKKYLVSAIIVLATLGTLLAILTFALSGQLARWQGNAETRTGFMIVAPTLILVSLIAGFRGWFQGEMYMLPTAVSNIIEQVVKLAVGIGLSVALLPRGVTAAVNGALLGIALSEACALAYLIITFLVRGKKLKGEMLHVTRTEAHVMFKVAFPIAIVAVLMPLSGFFDSVIIVNMLKSSGVAQELATAQYGLLSGPVNSLINMPIVIIMSLAVVVVPSVSVSRVQRDIDGVMLKSRLSIKLEYLRRSERVLFYGVRASASSRNLSRAYSRAVGYYGKAFKGGIRKYRAAVYNADICFTASGA